MGSHGGTGRETRRGPAPRLRLPVLAPRGFQERNPPPVRDGGFERKWEDVLEGSSGIEGPVAGLYLISLTSLESRAIRIRIALTDLPRMVMTWLSGRRRRGNPLIARRNRRHVGAASNRPRAGGRPKATHRSSFPDILLCHFSRAAR